MLGEATIEHWHDADSGFAGRQALPVMASAQPE
jgi:hypothetical protein